ncbi:MAG TPA: transporter [Maritimibacter sp.]|nr:transporter [Maritimibacter sp.]
MLSILAITFPIFAVIALGFGLVRFGVFTPAAMQAFGAFVMQVAMPALIFQAVASRDISEVFNPAYMAAYALGGLGTMVIAFAWFSLVTDPGRRSVGVMGSSCPNSGFVGYPLMLILFPDIAGLLLAMNFLVENVLFIPLALVFMDLSKGGEQHLGAKIGRVLLSVLKRPLVIGLLSGLAFSALGLTLPDPVDRGLGTLAASAAALALVVIGGSLAGIPVKGNAGLAAQISLGKLVVQPLVTLAAVVALAGVGLALGGDLRTAVILSAAMPIFAIYVVFAQEIGREGLASLALLGSTVGAFVTVNLLLYVMT